MMTIRATAFAIAASLTAAVAAQAADEQRFHAYGHVEGWNVFVDTEKGNCLIEKIDEAENVVQMGHSYIETIAYIGVFTKAPTDIKKGDREGVVILLGENIYVGEATGMRGNITEGYSGGYVLTDDPQVVEDVAQQYEMVVFPEETYAFVVDLTGTKKAIELARECDDAQKS